MPRHQARHASPRFNRRRSIPALALLASVCSLPFLFHVNNRALADSPEATITINDASRQSRVGDATAPARSVRTVLRQIHTHRIHAQHQRHVARELQQDRRQRARRQADRKERAQVSQWVIPINGAELSAAFGEAGSVWSSGYHTGQDFTAPYGTRVLAAGAGSITFAGWSDAYGNKIEITHADGNQTWYAHLSNFQRTSGTVAPGDVIGYVGCSGNCYGTHLHFEFHPHGGAAADPIAWLRLHGAL